MFICNEISGKSNVFVFCFHGSNDLVSSIIGTMQSNITCPDARFVSFTLCGLGYCLFRNYIYFTIRQDYSPTLL